jgi:hypothetical protein
MLYSAMVVLRPGVSTCKMRVLIFFLLVIFADSAKICLNSAKNYHNPVKFKGNSVKNRDNSAKFGRNFVKELRRECSRTKKPG